MKLYYKTLQFRRGGLLQINLLYPCNLKCEYCSLHIPSGNTPKAKESTLEEWKEYIINFPHKIKEINISGGEPTLKRWLPEITNFCLDKGYHTAIYTNLFKPENILPVKKSYRFKIIATYHHSDSYMRFDRAYQMVKDRFEIEVWEIGTKTLPYSRVKPFNTMQTMKDNKFFAVSPDRELYYSCYEHLLEKGK